MKTITTYKFFIGVKNDQELKAKYKELSKSLHPDRGGNHEDFTSMSNEYIYIKEEQDYPVSNNTDDLFDMLRSFTQEEPQPQVTNLTYEELENRKALMYFTSKRYEDKTYDVLDELLKEYKQYNKHKLWLLQAVQKLEELEEDHFKYVFWIVYGIGSASAARQLYKKYLKN